MATQQMRSPRGYAPLRVQRTFQTLDDGRGGRAAALAESLGVIINAAPVVAQREGEAAYKAGMKARIDGVKRENAAATNKSMLGFMFSQRAKDGFDYQDAQLEIPVLQTEELLEMEKRLGQSRNPEDFRAYIAERDGIIKERLADKSDIYRYAVAEAMMKTRQDQAKLFTQWVIRNREEDRQKAAKAAAEAAAKAQAARLNAAQLAASASARLFHGSGMDRFRQGSTQSSPEAAPESPSVGPVSSDTSSSSRITVSGRNAPTGTTTALTFGGPDVVDVGAGIGPGSEGREAIVVADAGTVMNDASPAPRPATRDEGEVVPSRNIPDELVSPPDPYEVGRTAMGDYVRNAATQFGISAADAKGLYIEALVLEADRLNDERLLEYVPREHLNFEQQDLLNRAQDTIRRERLSRESEEAKAAEAEAKAEAARIEAEGHAMETQLAMQLANGEISQSEAVAALFENPFFYNNPDERNKALSRLGSINTTFTDPALEAATLAEFQDTLVRHAITGDYSAIQAAAVDAFANVRSDSGRVKITELVNNAERIMRDEVFKDLDPFYKNITQAFPSGVGSEQTLAQQLSGQGGKQYYEATVDTHVTAIFEDILLKLTQDWYAENPDAPRMPYRTRWELAQQANTMAIEQGQMIYGGNQTEAQGTPGDALERLKAIGGN